jgi:hypothetical protein
MKKDLVVAFAWGGGTVVLALLAKYAQAQGYIDRDTVLRLVIGANGLMIAHFGNLAPKRVAPSACAQQVARVSGWSSVLSGLVYAGLWAFAPIPVAITAGSGVIIAGLLVTLGYCYRMRAKLRTQRT